MSLVVKASSSSLQNQPNAVTGPVPEKKALVANMRELMH
jgi:hypothetical protein